MGHLSCCGCNSDAVLKALKLDLVFLFDDMWTQLGNPFSTKRVVQEAINGSCGPIVGTMVDWGTFVRVNAVEFRIKTCVHNSWSGRYAEDVVTPSIRYSVLRSLCEC
jgi:hypothetical protein